MPIHIGKPYIRQEADRTCLCALLRRNEQEAEAWFSVEPEYAADLTWERSDAFVIGFLTTAMRDGEDIFCEAPITKRLYYQLTTYLIPTMAANMPVYHAITIHAPVAEDRLPCEGAVATGWTGGVDSMYTLMGHIRTVQPGYRLTHLLIANNGALEGKHCRQNLDDMVFLARQGIARDLGLDVIGIDSNLHILQNEHYLSVAVFRLCAVVLAVQKLLRVFFHSAGGDFSLFKLDPENSARYEVLPLSCLETDNTHFYSSGGAASRMQKLEEMADFAPAQNYLHPCIYVGRTNCGTCLKCMRTMTGLYSLGVLENFQNVFDVERFSRQKEDYFFQLLNHRDHPLHAEILRSMQQRGVPIPPEALRRARIRRAATIVAQRNLKPKEDCAMSETLSVIIPAHQAEKYISQAVDSVRRQPWTGETEIIVIDDGSTDGTAAAARALGVQVLQKSQGGAASARNMGLRAATGQLILLLDADDVLTDGALLAMYAALAGGTDAVFAMAEDFISPELTEAQKAELKPRPAPYGGVLPGCSLIRRQVFDAVGLFDDTMKSGETVAWQLKLRDAGIKTVQIPTVTLKRRLHLTNTGRLHQKREMADYAALLRKRMKRT